MASLGIGEILRRERERQGVSLDEIAHRTRIQPRFLEAIEAEDFDSLPGLIFARSFVRQYAGALQLEVERMVAKLPKLDESTIRLPDPPAHPRRRNRYKGPSSGFASMVWSILAIAAGATLYTHFNPVARIREKTAAFRNPPRLRSSPRHPQPHQPSLRGYTDF